MDYIYDYSLEKGLIIMLFMVSIGITVLIKVFFDRQIEKIFYLRRDNIYTARINFAIYVMICIIIFIIMIMFANDNPDFYNTYINISLVFSAIVTIYLTKVSTLYSYFNKEHKLYDSNLNDKMSARVNIAFCQDKYLSCITSNKIEELNVLEEHLMEFHPYLASVNCSLLLLKINIRKMVSLLEDINYIKKSNYSIHIKFIKINMKKKELELLRSSSYDMLSKTYKKTLDLKKR